MSIDFAATYHHGRFPICLLMLWFFAASPGRSEIETGEPRDAYPIKYHDKAIDFVVGKMIKIDNTSRDRYMRYHIAISADMTGRLKTGGTISFRGDYLGSPNGSFTYNPNVSAGQTVIFMVAIDDSTEYTIVEDSLFPFGVRPNNPAVPPADVPLVAAAFKEMAANLAAPGGAGMPLGRARALLNDKNFYLRALACWRLVHHLEDVDDLKKIELRFQDPTITAAEALFLDDLLTGGVTGPAQAYTPTESDRYGMLRLVLRNQAEAKVEVTQPTTKP